MRVAIVGYGVEGRVSYNYWKSLGDDVTIVDESENVQNIPASAKAVLGKDALSHLNNFDLIVRTPPLRPDKIHTTGKVWSATNEFFARCPAPIIGVTGTKGKGTTSSLISQILKSAGKTVHLVGNIGVPALDELPKIRQSDIVVFELSSFQLWDLEKSPQTAVVLMIESDHMDVHSSMEEYVNAKANITKYQTSKDLLIYHPSNQYSAQIAAASPAGNKKRYLSEEGANIRGDLVTIDNQPICQTSDVGLIGAHNLENVCAAVTAAWQYTQDISAIKQGITSFKGLSHRLEFVREVNGVKFYDDSQATGVGSCLAAIRAFTSPTVLILGGSDKGVDITPVILELNPDRHFVVLIGQSSEKLKNLLDARNFNNYFVLGNQTNMSEIIKTALEHAKNGSVILLSPAHASFGMFKNYQDRGDQFKQIVAKL
jgi:UDP-N-acetylmuramoylalanine--D-glutamate ligase